MSKFNLGGGRAIVTFYSDTADNERFHAYLRSCGEPGNVAAVLSSVIRRGARRSPVVAVGETAAAFVSALNPVAEVRLITDDAVKSGLYHPVSDVRYYVGRDEVRVVNICNGNETQVFVGPLGDFPKWAANNTGLERVVGKDISFKYRGGTKVGEVRRVRVSTVSRNADGKVCIEGFDLAELKLDLNNPEAIKSAYRRYTSDKIVGEIEVVA